METWQEQRRWGFFRPLLCLALLAAFIAASTASSPADLLRASSRSPASTAHAFPSSSAAPRRRVQARPCSIPNPGVVIDVYKLADVYKRRNFPATQFVTMILHASFVVPDAIQFDSRFSCTVFRGKKERKFTIASNNNSAPVIKIWGTNNVLIYGINFRMPKPMATPRPSTNDKFCAYREVTNADYMGKWACGAIWMYDVWAVQVAKGNVYGRIDVYKGCYSRVDSMGVLVPADYEPGAIAVSLSGDGPNLIRSNVWITNNRFWTQGARAKGSKVGLMIYRGAVGVNVHNNRLTDFTLATMCIGYGVSNVGDAMLTNIINNEMYHSFGQIGAGTPNDVAGLYFDTHWVNPGNVLRCNYVQGGGHCLYLDYVSTDVYVDGLVCVETADGLKLNTGKNNVVRGMVLVNTTEPAGGYISCQNFQENHCDNGAGKLWGEKLKEEYQTPLIQKYFPYLTNFCAKTVVRGVNCNQGTTSQHGPRITGRCSGLPTENYAEIVSATYDGSTKNVYFQQNCDPFPSVKKLNTLKYFATSVAAARFYSPKKNDFGFYWFSPIRKKFPNFRSCPINAVGPKPTYFYSYLNLFNIPRPAERPITGVPSATVTAGIPRVKKSTGMATVEEMATVEGTGDVVTTSEEQVRYFNPYANARWNADVDRELRPGFMQRMREERAVRARRNRWQTR